MEIQPFPGSPSYVMGQGLGHLRSKGYTFLICTKAPHEEAIGCANVQTVRTALGISLGKYHIALENIG